MKNVFGFGAGLLIAALLHIANSTFAVSAYPYKVKVITQNGKEVDIFMRGDENHKYAITPDGYSLLSDSVGWWYAKVTESGEVQKSEFKLMSADEESNELKAFKEICPKGIVPVRVNNDVRRASGQQRVASASPIIGERRALVILMQYKDLHFKKTNEEFDALINELDYHQNEAIGSVRDYYRFASQGQLDFITDVYGPYTSKNTMSYYGRNSSAGGNDTHAVDLCIEAMLSLPKDIDYSLYDNDNDGLIDNVHIIFAGYGEEAGASSDAIWAHEYPHRIMLKNEIGYTLAGYSCSPELRGNRGNEISNIGVVCHELGHALGAMDYYDTNYGTGGEYFGTGQWDIMASGSWNDDGRSPANFNPYVRCHIFGWNSEVVLKENQQIVMPRIEVENPTETLVYRIDTGSEGDYYLLENRQQYYFDAALPGAGLMVYHIHPNIELYNKTNTVNASHPQGLYPVCASGSEPSKKKYGNINSPECPFPGSKRVISFSPTTSPAAVAWDGSSSKVSLSAITTNISEGTISFTTSGETIIDPEKPNTHTEKNLYYKESFESRQNSTISVSSIMGKAVWRAYKRNDFVMNADLIPNAKDGANIFMLFSGKDKSFSESEAISADIEVEAGKNYYLSFDIYCTAVANSQTPKFTLYVEDQYGEYNIYTFKDRTETWNTIEVPLVFADNTFRYKLYGQIQSGGVFIDNMQLYNEEEVSSVCSMYNDFVEGDLYNIHGLYIGPYHGKSTKIQQGVYIVKKANGDSYKIVIR